MATLNTIYKCEICGQVVPPHTKENRIVIETRDRKYPNRRREVSEGRGKTKTITIPGGTGYEIVREVVTCLACAENLMKKEYELTSL